MSGEISQKFDKVSFSRRTLLKGAGAKLLPGNTNNVGSAIESVANPALLQTRISRRLASSSEPVLPTVDTQSTSEDIFRNAMDTMTMDKDQMGDKSEGSVIDRLRGNKDLHVEPVPEKIPNSVFIGEIDRILSQSKKTKISEVKVDPDKSVKIRALTIPDGDNSLSLSIITPSTDTSNRFQLVHMAYQIDTGKDITISAAFTSYDEFPTLDLMGVDLPQDKLGLDDAAYRIYQKEREKRGYNVFNGRAWFETLTAAEAIDTRLNTFPVASLGERIFAGQSIAKQLLFNEEFQGLYSKPQGSTEKLQSLEDVEIDTPSLETTGDMIDHEVTGEIEGSDTAQDLIDAEQDYKDGKYAELDKDAIMKKISKPSLHVATGIAFDTTAAFGIEATSDKGIELKSDEAQDFLASVSTPPLEEHQGDPELPADDIDVVMDAFEKEWDGENAALPTGDPGSEETDEISTTASDEDLSLN